MPNNISSCIGATYKSSSNVRLPNWTFTGPTIKPFMLMSRPAVCKMACFLTGGLGFSLL